MPGHYYLCCSPVYWSSVISLFIIGSALAIIQVSSVPLLRQVCGAGNLAFHSTLNQLLYGLGAFVSPLLFSWFVIILSTGQGQSNYIVQFFSAIIPANLHWISVYYFFALLLIVIIILIANTVFPIKSIAVEEAGSNTNIYWQLLQNKKVLFFFIALAAYVSCEQGNAVWMSEFFSKHHHLNPETTGASILSWYWILLSLGCMAGLFLLKIWSSRFVLGLFTLCAVICFSLSLYGPFQIAKITYPLVGFFESVMWPIILSLAVNSVNKNHETLTGFMFTASVGGVVGSVIIGNISDAMGVRIGLQYIYLPLMIVLSVALFVKPGIQKEAPSVSSF